MDRFDSLARDFQECPFRQPRSSEAGGYDCRLLAHWIGNSEPCLIDASRDVCERCARHATPSVSELNPGLAARLIDVTQIILGEGGIASCSTDAARNLHHWGIQYLGAVNKVTSSPHDVVAQRGPCEFLGKRLASSTDSEVHACLHPNHETTSPQQCQLCTDWKAPGQPAPRPLDDFLPVPPRKHGPAVRRWAVGVTTSPRLEPTVEFCLDTLIRAGWTHPRIFMDGTVSLAERHRHLPVTRHEPRVRAWPNYYLALTELLMREPHADAFMLVQDDALFYDGDNLRAYLERMLWPAEQLAAVSLYCSSAESQAMPGWYEHGGTWTWGATAFVFSRESAKAFVSDASVLEHRWSRRNDGCANIDTEIGLWSRRTGRIVCFPTPSLVQHIGEVSTLWPTASATGRRRADQFAGDRK